MKSTLKSKEKIKLPSIWKHVQEDYDVVEFIGSGSFGQVVKARAKDTGDYFAIKLIKNVFHDMYHCKKVLREIMIMRQFSKMPKNVFTTKLHDVILPCTSVEDLKTFNEIFLVMDYIELDLKRIFTTTQPPCFTESHVVTIMYNVLCALNFMHSANVIHRDIKPANILINSECAVKICDFGLARIIPDDLQRAQEKMRLAPTATIRSPSTSHTDEVPHRDLTSAFSQAVNLKEGDDSGETKQFTVLSDSKRKSIAERLGSDRTARQSRDRQLSSHVMSRWYRAPEIILSEPEYSTQADMWSMGCVLGEMINFTDDYKKSGIKVSDRFLFEGSSCFPLSPCQEMRDAQDADVNIVSRHDQFLYILKLLGDPNDELTQSFLTVQPAIDYYKQLTKKQGAGIQKKFKLSSPDMQLILQSLLELNPYFRCSAKEILKSPIFDQIRVAELEEPAPFKLDSSIDAMGAYDYEENKDLVYKSKDEYRKAICKEIKKLKRTNTSSSH